MRGELWDHHERRVKERAVIKKRCLRDKDKMEKDSYEIKYMAKKNE